MPVPLRDAHAHDQKTGRRAFMASVGGGLLVWLALRAGAARGHQGPLLVGCGLDAAGEHVACGIDRSGAMHFEVALPGRGHSVAFTPDARHCIVFARRPGTFAVVIDVDQGVALHRLDAAKGRHFYGHGAFSGDGRFLFTTENDIDTGRGVIGVRDAGDGYREIGALPSDGIGPHELILMPDGAMLAIANGGILTRPETGRAKLNLDTMEPSLVYLDLGNGKSLDAFRLQQRLHRNSIRHLTSDAAGRVGFAMQYEGPASDRVPLVGLHGRDGLRTFEPPRSIERRMRHYAGSIVFDAGGEILGVAHPRGGLVTFWDAASGALAWHVDVADGCGIAASEAPGVFVVTSGHGTAFQVDVRARSHAQLVAPGSPAAWDNHLFRRPA